MCSLSPETMSPSFTRFATRSFADEFGGAINDDLIILNIAIILLLTYTVVMLSRWSKGCVGSRIFLAVGGFISIGMAIGSALGIGSYAGLFYSPLMSVFPFLILGEARATVHMPLDFKAFSSFLSVTPAISLL